METENKRLLEYIDETVNLYGEYIRKFISLGVRYNRSETLELAEEFMDKHNKLVSKKDNYGK